MMPNAAKQWPREYSGGQAGSLPDHQTIPGIPAVVTLWEHYNNPQTIRGLWTTNRQILKVAHTCFNAWFLSQDNNPYIHGYNYDFLVDTIHYIGTGYRRLSRYTWMELVSHPDKPTEVDVTHRQKIYQEMEAHGLLGLSIEALLQKWCSHPEGIDDMMYSLNIVFGDITRRYS